MGKQKKPTAAEVLTQLEQLSVREQNRFFELLRNSRSPSGLAFKQLVWNYRKERFKNEYVLKPKALAAEKFNQKDKRRTAARNLFIFEELHIRRGLSVDAIHRDCQDEIRSKFGGKKTLGHSTIRDACKGK